MTNLTATPRIWQLWACKHRGRLWRLGDQHCVELHGLSHPVVPVIAREATGDPAAPEVTHYGWEYTDRPGKIAMIYPRVTGERCDLWMFLDMCFAYGMDAEVAAGKGRMVALVVEEVASHATESLDSP